MNRYEEESFLPNNLRMHNFLKRFDNASVTIA